MWAPIDGFDDYAISSHGRVKNLKFDRMLTPRSNGYGYKKVALRRENESHERLVHQLVAQAFVGGYYIGAKVKHHNGDNGDNHVFNLRLMAGAKLGRLVREHDPVSPRRIKIVETGQVFRGAAEAARHLYCDKSSIYAVLRGTRKSHRGYSFEYCYGEE